MKHLQISTLIATTLSLGALGCSELAHEPGSPARVACPSVEHAAATRRSIEKKIEGRAAEVVREYLRFHGYANTLKCIEAERLQQHPEMNALPGPDR